MPRVSVIVPVFNQAQFVCEAVESVLGQTYRDFELIIVDDGSSDDIRAIAESYADGRVKYVRQVVNRGPSAARNRGMDDAEGEYIAFLDGDDTFHPQRLEVQVDLLDRDPATGLAAGGWVFVDELGRTLVEERPWLRVADLSLSTWLFGCPVVPSAVLVRRSWLCGVGGFDQQFRRSEDWDLWLRLARAGCEMKWTERVVCSYRLHSGNTVRDAASQSRGHIHMFDKFFSDPGLPSEVRDLKDEVYARALVAGAWKEYVAGQVVEARADLTKAVQLDSDCLHREVDLMIQGLVSSVALSLVSDPAEQISMIFANLPDSADWLRRYRHKAAALLALTGFYSAYKKGDWPAVRRLFRQAVVHDPSWLANRGTVSMWAESLVGRRWIDPLRALKRRLRNTGADSTLPKESRSRSLR